MAAEIGISADRIRVVLRQLGIDAPGDRATRNVHRPTSNRTMDRIVTALEHLALDLRLIDLAELDRRRLTEWSAALRESAATLTDFIRQLTKES
jgi:hypothetical protein